MNYFLYFIVITFITLSPSLTYSYEITFAWDSNTESDLEGYRLYSREGNPCPPYDHVDIYPENELADPLNPMLEIYGLEPDGKYYFVVTAYDTAGNESDFSTIISVINGQGEYANCSSKSSDEGGGGGGGGCLISNAAYGFRMPKELPFFMLLFGFLLIGISKFKKKL